MATMGWIKQLLEIRGLAYQELEHEEVFTSQEVAQREHVSGHHLAKVVVVLADGQPIELIVPASRHVALDQVRKLLNAREVRLASESELKRIFPDVELGAIPPLRHWDGVDLLMDTSMKVDGDILFQAGTHHDAVRMHYQDWFNLAQPRVAAFTA